MQRVGIGYDVHRLVKGRKLFLGGVEIPYEKGLQGHSDADVLLHAICDAILGALGKGDIGEHFPNTDEAYRDISSMELLQTVYRFVKDAGFLIGNIDAVILAEEPNLKTYKQQMRGRIAEMVGLPPECVSIKAGTNEGLGAVGEKKGMAAYATVLLNQGK